MDRAGLSWSVSGDQLTLTWPVDQIGWQLEVQTNGLSPLNWVAVPGSTTTNRMILPMDSGNRCVFYRLQNTQ